MEEEIIRIVAAGFLSLARGEARDAYDQRNMTLAELRELFKKERECAGSAGQS